ncbi:non-ribosomal peptide synthetase [Nostoc sp. FACHB-280]|uniref:non-ribosomal peptide synthetase n=1 Tax=Nostoc sp. FACHB-280 TaxID=2692839 RepID=UPI00168A8B09|nr:non-ribosomal peptide synthetase [Nostoc sp. FACHB-280]MBD2494910.1 amino acid adenylation domain-containing protein [Nostoc sp. FACHB-280]
MKPNNIEDIYELSPMQQGMLFHKLAAPDSVVYFEQNYFTLQTPINIPAFQKAWQRVVDRHPILRTAFYWENLDKPYQVVYKQVDLPWEFQDWQHLSLEEQQKQFADFLKADGDRGFALGQAPLIRLTLIQMAEDNYQFVFSFHHILMEGWSLSWLWKEFYEFYDAFCQAQDLYLERPRPYQEYITWLQQQDQKKAESFWRQKLQGFTVPTPILIGKNAANFADQPADYHRQELVLSATMATDLKAFARKYQLTLNIIIKGAWALLLSRYSQESDVVFGSTSSGRPTALADAESMIGLFINTLPLRVKVDNDAVLTSWLKQLQTEEVQMREYEYSPLSKIQQWSQVSPGLPLFDSILVFDNELVDYNQASIVEDIGVVDSKSLFDWTNYPITVKVVPNSESLNLYISYNNHQFESSSMSRILEHLKTLLAGFIANPEAKLRELPMLTAQENQQILQVWNNTATNYALDKCIHELFEQQVNKTPDAVAVEFANQQLTYQQLNTKANQLAHYLRSLGVKPEVLVGICVERSLDMIIGLLAILKAGGAYIPLDPNYPSERIAYILEDTQAPVLLTQASLLAVMPPHQAKVICLDTDWHHISQHSQGGRGAGSGEQGENLSPPLPAPLPPASSVTEVTTENLAYVIYTSGSTGKPKGVQIPHLALTNFLYSMQQAPGLTAEDTLLAVTTYSFDIAALELFLPMIVGARLVIASQEIISDGVQLAAKIAECQATVMQATPATWQLLLAAGWDGNHQLKILCGGEALPEQLANQLLERCRCLWNMYGPTETTIWSAACQVKTVDHTVPISSPIANTQLYILDQNHQLMPVGVAGELCIGGLGLARGYFQRPDLTAEKFIPNPFSETAARLYKTGDLARYLPNGDIEYLGRIDHQVKIRGFRIELGEIAAVISQHPAVRETVVTVHGSAADTQRIVAYIVPHTGQTFTSAELRDLLAAKLPNYMMPAAFVTLEALPLTPNGKVDRKALKPPEFTPGSASSLTPATPIENLLAGIWAEILGIDKVGIDQNFFELGGHSLIATRVISQIRQVFQIELPLRYLFEKLTIAGLAKEIEKAIQADLTIATTKIEKIARSPQLPLSFAQQRLWFLSQLEPNSPFYNIPAAVRLQGQLNVAALAQSFSEIVTRHEALRTNFVTTAGQVVAAIAPEKPLNLSTIDLSDLETNEQAAKIKHLADLEAQQPFDISRDHLLRVKLLRLSEQEHIVLVTMHHIVSDAWSIGILVQELAALYPAFCDGQPSPLPALPIQYVDFAAWQRQWLQGQVLETQISYWRKQLANAPTVLELPTDYPRPAIQTFQGATYSFELSIELSTALQKFSQQQGSTLFMTLLASFQILLWRYTGQKDIVVGSPIANRNRAEIEGLIGFFVNTLVLRTNLGGNPSFVELLKQVREMALGAYAHQDVPFELLVEQLQPQRDLSHTPLFQVMFVLQNAPMSALKLPGLTLTPEDSSSDSAKFDLTLYVTETDSGLVASLEYNTDLFKESTICRMASHLQTLLAGIVANPQQRLSELPLLNKSEQHQLLREWNDTAVAYPQHLCIHELFEQQVTKTPDAVAVEFANQQLTYQELNTKANQLAHYLRSLGVKPEVLVGICVERSLDMIIGLLAILKAGGAYIPLDPNYPSERIAYILEDTQAPVLLTQTALLAVMPLHQAKVICLDTDWHNISQHSQENLVTDVTPENLAYIIYTSGSTGKPKGVMIQHASTVAMLDWADKTFSREARAGVLASTSICFDLSVFEMFVPLCCGGKVILIENALYISNLPATCGVTLINTVPSVIAQLLQTDNIPASVQTVNIAGEPLQNQLVQKLYQQAHIQQVFNLYGPSEDTTYSTFALIQKGASGTPPIGRPIHNTQAYLLDENLQPVPVGVPGMLYLGGAGLARGYLNKLELTADKFIPHPYANVPGERLYKTGDLARYLPNGEIEYIGRIDNQVKIRGFRIELGEIEALTIQHPGVEAAVVTVVDAQQIIAYVVFNSEQPPTIAELRGFLEAKLPNYMIPAAFVTLAALPLTPNGKVDRKALPAPDTTHPELTAVYQPPQTELEKTIADVWQAVLNIERVGIHDNFFELGGHSLLLIQVHSQLQKILQKDFLLVEMFQYPTVSRLARYFSQEYTVATSTIPNSHRAEQRTASTQRRKQARKEYRAATNQTGE